MTLEKVIHIIVGFIETKYFIYGIQEKIIQMDISTLSAGKHVSVSYLRTVGSENESIGQNVNYQLADIYMTIDRFYQAVCTQNYSMLPAISSKLKPFFVYMGIETESLEEMENPNTLSNDFRKLQKLYIKVKMLCEAAIDTMKVHILASEAKSFNTDFNPPR